MSDLNFLFITNDEATASICEASGVGRVMVDLEIEGKKERQIGRNTLISDHCLQDVVKLRRVLSESELWVRINPLSERSPEEIEAVIAAGADAIMLPMADYLTDVLTFSKLIDGRVKRVLLLETVPALIRASDLCTPSYVDEVHVGLNDMHIDGRLDFMFELMASHIMESLCSLLSARGIPFGIGGVAPISQKQLLPAHLILTQHARLNSTQVILSRAFREILEKSDALYLLKSEILRLQYTYSEAVGASDEEKLSSYREFKECVEEVCENSRRR